MEFIKIHGQILLKVIIRDTRIYAVRTNIFVSESHGQAVTAGNQELRVSQYRCKGVTSCCKRGSFD